MDSNIWGQVVIFFTNIAKYCLDGVVWLLKSVSYLILDGVLTAISAFFMLLDFSSFVSSYAMSWAGVPDQMIWFINAVSIPAGIAMMCGAIGLRMALNLIPAAFTRI